MTSRKSVALDSATITALDALCKRDRRSRPAMLAYMIEQWDALQAPGAKPPQPAAKPKMPEELGYRLFAVDQDPNDTFRYYKEDLTDDQWDSLNIKSGGCIPEWVSSIPPREDYWDAWERWRERRRRASRENAELMV